MLDINLFRADKGGNPEVIRESQRRRHKDVGLVDRVIELDNSWRKSELQYLLCLSTVFLGTAVQLVLDFRGRLDTLKMQLNKVSKATGDKMKALKGAKPAADEVADLADELVARLETLAVDEVSALTIAQLKKLSGVASEAIKQLEDEVIAAETARDKTLCLIGNIVHERVPVSDNEDNNTIHRVVGDVTPREGLKNHVDLMRMIDGMDTERGTDVAGGRAYFLKGRLVQLHLAVVHYAISFLVGKGYTPLYTPFFMNQKVMGQVAQLEQFDEELYKVTGEGDDKYLIATSEQPIAAYHREEWLAPAQLPIRYTGFSTCFRKEVGSHGRDTLGIFRVHQFDKIEQFCITSPSGSESWDMMETMIANSEEFYQNLGLPYRVISIVSGALNNAAAMKYDLEGWFPASKTFRELVSCSNCTDYQSRRLDIRFGQVKKGDTGASQKEFVHMLNSTLCATTRTLCIIAETYQTESGIRVPEVLKPFMAGCDFIPFVNPAPAAAAASSSK